MAPAGITIRAHAPSATGYCSWPTQRPTGRASARSWTATRPPPGAPGTACGSPAGASKEVRMQPVAFQPVTIGWIIAILVLLLAIIFAVIGLPDPRVVLILIAGLAVARLL